MPQQLINVTSPVRGQPGARITADGFAEREADKAMINDARQVHEYHDASITPSADKGYDAKEFIDALQTMKVLPHVARNTSGRRSAVPDEIAVSVGHQIPQTERKLIEQGFGWAKPVGRKRQVMVRRLEKVDQMFVLTMSAYNLTRLRTLGSVRLQTGTLGHEGPEGLKSQKAGRNGKRTENKGQEFQNAK